MLKYFIFSLIAIFALSSQGCRKKKDTLVEVTVKDVNNQLVSGATVNMFPVGTVAPSPGYLWNYTETTGSNGTAVFNFNDIYQLGQAGVAVSNIKATKAGVVGNSVVKIEAEKVTSKIVYL